MPIYEFKCKKGCRRTTERYFHVDECPDRITCRCGKTARKIISRVAGHTDGDVKWLPSARQVLQPDHELRTRPIETRGQYRQYLKDHGLIATG
jgi:putative FmdB family regulatory protein